MLAHFLFAQADIVQISCVQARAHTDLCTTMQKEALTSAIAQMTFILTFKVVAPYRRYTSSQS